MSNWSDALPTQAGWYWFVGYMLFVNLGIVEFDRPAAVQVLHHDKKNDLWLRYGMVYGWLHLAQGRFCQIADAPALESKEASE